MSEQHHEEDISGPIPVVVHPVSSTGSLTKMFTWLAAALLAGSVFVSLVGVTMDRNDLRNQVREQSLELACRAEAANEYNTALTVRLTALGNQAIAIGDLVVAIGQGDTDISDEIDAIHATDDILDAANKALEQAAANQEAAITNCDK